MYLNIILTILCIVLITMFISFIYFWKKYLKNFFNGGFNLPFENKKSSPNLDDPFKLMNEFMKNFPKR